MAGWMSKTIIACYSLLIMKTKALIVSDLHLYFGKFKAKPEADIIIVAGDSCEGFLAANMYHYWLNLGYKIIMVCGNHEYYGKPFNEVNAYWRNFANKHENFYFLNNNVLELDGHRFVGTTLWGSVPPDLEFYCRSELNDFSNIYFDSWKEPFTPVDMNSLHEEAKRFLKKNIQEGDILVTHHAPTFASIPDKYKSNPLNCCYVGNIENIILDANPKLAIHGHIHNSTDYFVGETRVIANPRGYVNQSSGYNKSFDSNFIIEL